MALAARPMAQVLVWLLGAGVHMRGMQSSETKSRKILCETVGMSPVVTSTRFRFWLGSVCAAVTMVTASCTNPVPEGHPIDGSLGSKACGDFYVRILDKFDIDIPDPGWSWVKNAVAGAPKIKSATGRVVRSTVSDTDFPASHQSHDMNIDVQVDNPQQDILSDVGKPNDERDVSSSSLLRKPTTLEMEWEIGVSPEQTGKTVIERYFPRWAWPSVGDRVWADGHWIFDCGHAKGVAGTGHLKTELHPLRAIASIRRQARPLTATQGVPIPVTVADVYIHGEAGFATDILNCGQKLLFEQYRLPL